MTRLNYLPFSFQGPRNVYSDICKAPPTTPPDYDSSISGMQAGAGLVFKQNLSPLLALPPRMLNAPGAAGSSMVSSQREVKVV